MNTTRSSDVRERVFDILRTIAMESNKELALVDGDDTVLLESGLDSLDFAVAVARLEQELDADPFAVMESAYYPRTLGEFVAAYQHFFDTKATS